MTAQTRIAPSRMLLTLSLLGLALSTPARAAEQNGWISLFDGQNLQHWTARTGQGTGQWDVVGSVALDPGDPKKFVVQPGNGVMMNGESGRTVDLMTRDEFGDVEAHLEFVVPQGSNSGVYFQARYEVQILDSWGVETPAHGDCGGIYQRWKDGRGYEGHPPRVNASRRPGEWQTFDVVFRAPRFDASGNKTANARFVKVIHNGVVVQENVEVTGPTRAAAYETDERALGPLMIQGDHGPVAFRNVRVRPLKD